MKRGMVTAGLIAFLLVDIVLVYAALRPPAASTAVTSGSSGTTSPGGTPSITPSGTASKPPVTSSGGTSAPQTDGAQVAKPVSILLVGLDAQSAWRATTGTCKGGGASLSTTRNGGGGWNDVKVPTATISRVQPLDGGTGFVVGAERGCGENEFTTDDAGATWSGPKTLVGGWARKLGSPNELVTPQNVKSRPCGDADVLDLSRISATQAEALCAAGSVKVTSDGGVSWSDSGEAEGAVAISNRTESGVLTTYAARVGIKECDGVQVAKVVRGTAPTVVACVETTGVAPGNVAISAAAAAGWLVVGDGTWTSDAALAKWSAARG